MQLKQVIQQSELLKYMVDSLELCSGLARRVLLESPWLQSPQDLEAQATWLQSYIQALAGSSPGSLEHLKIKLSALRDIRGSLQRLQDGGIPDEVEWFEIKSLAILSLEISQILPAVVEHKIPSLQGLLKLLDPEGQAAPSFYIYDAYSIELAELRKLWDKESERMDAEAKQALFEKMARIEMRVREMLAQKAQAYVSDALTALTEVALVDIGFAKARQMQQWSLVIPQVLPTEADSVYEGLFHPQVAERLAAEGRRFQPVDLRFGNEPLLITGSNMGGKTVVLSMVSCAQCLFQFGFAVPALTARIAPVDKVVFSLAVKTEMQRGLSSFASEITHINSIIQDIRQGQKVLAVFDEPAQTTNPVEGTALVTGLLSLLQQWQVRAILTTHYSGIVGAGRRLRVKGFSDATPTEGLHPGNIEQYMDYSLVEADEACGTPQEALRVARLLGVDVDWVHRAVQVLDSKTKQ